MLARTCCCESTAARALEGGPYIVDVGFGGLTLTGPLRLVPDIEQATPHETFRLLAGDRGEYVLQVLLGGAWKPLYSFDLQPQLARRLRGLELASVPPPRARRS